MHSIIKVYIVTTAFVSPSNSTIYFIIATKKLKLAIRSNMSFSIRSYKKINCELLRLAQMHFTQYILLLINFKF